KGYFRAAKSVCDKFGALLILDEVIADPLLIFLGVGTLHEWESFGDGNSPDIQ
ncbi:hypothetical protein B0H13DRAFT_1484535, partial [Mycena leptocephala]